jgi:ketosteroid isomerase-like protein
MRKAGLILCGVLFTTFLFAQKGPFGNAEEAKLISLERMWNQAQMQHDAIALKNMIGDRFVNTEWDGEVSNRGEFLAEIADPKFDPATMSVQDLKIEFYGDTAVVVGVYHTRGKYNGKLYEHVGRFTDTWVRQNTAWKCVASHSSLIQK